MPVRKSRMPSSSCARADGANRIRGPRSQSFTRGSLPTVRTGGRRLPLTSWPWMASRRRYFRPASTTRLSCGRPRCGRSSMNRSSARRPALGARPMNPIPTAMKKPTRIATCWWSAEDQQGSWRRLRQRARERGCCWRTRGQCSAARCLEKTRKSTPPAEPNGRRRSWANSLRCRRLPSCREPRCSGGMTATSSEP